MNKLLRGVIGAIAGLMFGIMAIEVSGMGDLNHKAVTAIQQCEQNLPRNQHCEVVVTARVVEE